MSAIMRSQQDPRSDQWPHLPLCEGMSQLVLAMTSLLGTFEAYRNKVINFIMQQ